MTLGNRPDVALAPVAQLPELLNLGMQLDSRVAQRQAPRVKHPHVAAQALPELEAGAAGVKEGNARSDWCARMRRGQAVHHASCLLVLR